LARFAGPLLEELEPFGDRIAVIGQVGVVGPVALATARLRVLVGDHDRAHADLARARAIGARTAAAPTLARCDLLAAELAESDEQRRAVAVDVAVQAGASACAGSKPPLSSSPEQG
jgi:hypothetical protein